MPKVNEKEQKLLSVIEKARKELNRLKEKQKLELGALACRYNLHELDLTVLTEEFSRLAKQHGVVRES